MWFNKWFNEDYLLLYSHRSGEEAKEHVAFIQNQLQLSGNERVLDLACGAGRHSLSFARKGFDVVGVDLSGVLINRAKEEAAKFPNACIEFKVADLFHLPQMGKFDLIINLFTSFGYFEDDRLNQEFFHIVRSHLHEKGQFFLDFLHPFAVRANLIESEEKWINDELVQIKRSIQDDCVVKTIQFPGRTYQEKVKMYNRAQIEKMIQNAYMSVVSVWNDYDGNPWKEQGDRQLFRCMLN